jgi:Flp pilus assembly protein TadD
MERGRKNTADPSRRSRARAGWAVATLTLLLLAGCATGNRPQPEVPEPAPAVPVGPSVTRLEDGRAGFVIRETPELDDKARADFDRAIALMEDGDYPGAVELLKQVVEKSPGVTAPHIDLAMACRRTGDLEQAETHLKAALELVAGHPVAGNEYGLLLRQSGRFAEARSVFEQTLTAFPEYLPVHRNLGILCDLYLNDPACALEQYQLYSAAVPEDKQVRMWIADLRLRLGSGQ